MALPLKDYRPGLTEITHKVMSRVAKHKGMSLEALGRKWLDERAQAEVAHAKEILGIDTDADQLDFIGNNTESTGTPRKGGR